MSAEVNIAPTLLVWTNPLGVAMLMDSARLASDSATEMAEERRAAVAVSLANTLTARFAAFTFRTSDCARIR